MKFLYFKKKLNTNAPLDKANSTDSTIVNTNNRKKDFGITSESLTLFQTLLFFLIYLLEFINDAFEVDIQIKKNEDNLPKLVS